MASSSSSNEDGRNFPTILDLGEALLKEVDMRKAAEKLLHHMKESLAAERGVLYLVSDTSPPPNSFKGLKTIAEYTLKSRNILNIPDLKQSLMWEKTALSRMNVKAGQQVRVKSLLSSPIPAGQDSSSSSSSARGALVFINKRDKARRIVPFTVDDERALGMFAVLLGMTLHKNEEADSLSKNLALRNDVFYHYGAILPEQLDIFMAAEADLQSSMPSLVEEIRSSNFDPHVYSPADDRLCLIFKEMFLDAGFNEKFKVTDQDLTRYILTVRKHYRSVPYHNFTHAISVTHGVYSFLRIPEIKNVLTELEKISLFIAAVNHDIDHRGRNNEFQKNAETLLAAVYSTSTMERHHFNHALDILHIAGDFIVNHLTAVERTVFVEKLEQAILATDLKLHMTLVRPKLAGIVAERTLDFSKSTHKDLVSSLLMTCSDLISSTKTWDNVQKTADHVYAEFFMQGDEEQHLGLPLSSNLVDRNNIDNIPSLQTGFQQHIAIPAFDLLSKIFPSCSYLLEAVHANCKRWSDLGAK